MLVVRLLFWLLFLFFSPIITFLTGWGFVDYIGEFIVWNFLFFFLLNRLPSQLLQTTSLRFVFRNLNLDTHLLARIVESELMHNLVSCIVDDSLGSGTSSHWRSRDDRCRRSRDTWLSLSGSGSSPLLPLYLRDAHIWLAWSRYSWSHKVAKYAGWDHPKRLTTRELGNHDTCWLAIYLGDGLRSWVVYCLAVGCSDGVSLGLTGWLLWCRLCRLWLCSSLRSSCWVSLHRSSVKKLVELFLYIHRRLT